MAQLSESENLVAQLNQHFLSQINGTKVRLSKDENLKVRQLFSRNIVFLRAYLGLVAKGVPYDQIEFSDILGISVPGLRRWEAGDVLPNKLSLRAVCQLANKILNTPIPIENAHLLYRNLVNEITLLRMGTHDNYFQNLPSDLKRKFASFVNNNMDQVLEYFMQEAHETRINYHVLLENALVGIYVMDDSGRIIYINSTLANASGYPLQGIDKIDFESIVHPEDLDSARKRLNERLTGSTTQERYLLRIRHKAGQYRTYEVFSSSITLNGKPAILGVLQDITERLNTERLLKEKEERYHSLFTSMFSAFALHEVITDKNGKPVNFRYIDVNPAFEKMTGLKAENVIGKTVLEILPGTESHWIERFGNIALTGKPDYISEYSREFDKYFEVHGYSPQAGQFAVTFMDVTDKVKSQQEAFKLKFIVEHTNAMILLSRFGTNDLLYANKALCEELGYSLEELLRINLDDLDKSNINIRHEAIKELEATGKAAYQTQFLKKNGTPLPARLNLFMSEYQGEKLVCAGIELLNENDEKE